RRVLACPPKLDRWRNNSYLAEDAGRRHDKRYDVTRQRLRTILFRRSEGSNVRTFNEIMAILKIARMGHPVLAQKAEPVANPGALEIRRLVSDMVETMIDANGAGLAAPQ